MGKLCPRNRFKEFHKYWKLVKFGEYFKIIMGQSPSSKNYINNNEYNVLVQGNADIKNGHINPRIFTTEITKLSKKMK
ncbi:hypothetical protein MOO44_08545 [Nicoliella spurrieriana]|uniref:Uncharacterized protein n=1 Tax=Nicoliella spurrieriana TaxID=2925830 RepID=A0A976X5T5_9LACO|nr:hypothetical protein [Nicoliella spurrieriana]UQS86897.1 hypothetical protein MOO44_08545 [Nicoliella spurrieriana]